MGTRTLGVAVTLLVCCVAAQAPVAQQVPPLSVPARTVASIRPDYLPPSDILEFLGVRLIGSLGIMRWQGPEDRPHEVEIRHNDAANLILVAGDQSDIDYIENLIREADIPPRQIEIEVKIIEISTTKARDLGLDWERLITASVPQVDWTYREQRTPGEDKTIYRSWQVRSAARLSEVVRMLDETGAGTVRTAPKILTLNNRRATILDGERVTYVTRYASFTNLFETDSMDAGLTISVLPSIGESGYITLDINAEMTALAGSISGSPIKTGQLVENTVIVLDGESILLGGLTRTVEIKNRRRFPLLGHVLPFLFSRETTSLEEIESFMVLTPRAVDFATAPEPGIEGDAGGK